MIDPLRQWTACQSPNHQPQVLARLTPRWNLAPGSRLIPHWTRLREKRLCYPSQNGHPRLPSPRPQPMWSSASIRITSKNPKLPTARGLDGPQPNPRQPTSSTQMETLQNHTCPLCGAANRCAVAAEGSFAVDCWCASASISAQALSRVPEPLRGKACLCAACATGSRAEAESKPKAAALPDR